MPRTRLRRALTVGGLLLATLLLVVALGLFPQEPGRRALEARLREATGPGSRIGSAEVRPGALWAELRDVVVEAPGYRLEAARVEIAVSPRTLSGHGLHLRRLVVDGASIQWLPDQAPALVATSPWAGPLTIEQVQAEGARLTWDSGATGPVRIEGLSVTGGVGSGRLRVTSTGGTWDRTPAVALAPAELILRIAPDLEVNLDSAHAGLQRSRVTAAGALGRPGALAPDLAFDARFALDELAALGAWPAGEIDGELRATGRVHGSADAPVVEARLASERARLRTPLERVEGSLTLREGRLDVSLQARALGGSARVTAARSRDGRIDARALVHEARLERLRELGVEADLTGVGDAELTLRGDPAARLALELTTRARGQAAGEDFDGEARAQGHVATDGALDAEWTANVRTAHGPVDAAGRARAAAGGTLEVAGHAQARPAFHGWPDGAVLDATFRRRDTALSARVDLSGLGQPLVVEAVAETAQGSRPARFESLRVEAPAIDLARAFPGELTGRATLRFDLSGPPEALDGRGRIAIEDGRWRGVALGPVTADLVARAGIARVTMAAPGLAARLDGELSTATRRASGDLVLDGTDFARASAPPAEGEPIAGSASGTVHFEVELDRPAEASLEARFTSLQASRGPWSARSTGDVEFALRNRVLHLQRLVVEGAGAVLDATGRVTLADEPQLDLTVRGRADLAGLPHGDLQNLAGRATLEARLTGTTHDPRADGLLRIQELTAQAAGAPVLVAAQVDVTLAGDRARIGARGLTLAAGQLELEGEVPFGREPARLALSWSGVSAAEMLSAARPASVETLEATLAGRLDVVAPSGLRNAAALVRDLEAHLRLEPVEATTGDLRFATDVVEATLHGGRLSVAPFSLSSAGSRFEVAASADLERREIAASGRGQIELRALSPLLSDTALTGRAVVDLGIDGPWSAPRARGTLEVQDATARVRSMPQALTDIAARLRFEGSTVRVETASARLGGGPLTVTGAARLAAGGLADAAFDIQLRDAALRYPPGLRTRIGADLRLTGSRNAWLLAGDVRSARGLYDLDEAMAADATEQSSPLLRALRLDLRVRTEAPIAVISNLGELQATGDLRIRGDAFAPEPFGALRLSSGGRVYIQGREFRVDSTTQSALTYSGTWDPTLAIHAVTAARVRDAARNREVEVKVALQGRLESPAVRLEATGYSESELLNLLATGDSRASVGRAAAGAQAAAVLVGRVGRQIRSLGLDEVSIQPELVAREGGVDTGARFTVGKRVTPWASLVYSASLQDPNARYLELRTQPGVALGLGGVFDAGAAGELNVSGRRRDDGGLAAGAGQLFRRGGPRPPQAPDERVTLTGVRVEGVVPPAAGELRRSLAVEPGDRRTIWQLQDRAERARESLRRRGFLEAEVAARIEQAEAVFEVRSGPRFSVQIDGVADAPALEGVLADALYEGDALDRGRERLLAHLRRGGHLRAVVEARGEAGAAGERVLRFAARPGPRGRADVRFPGAQAVSPSALLRAAGGAGALLADERAARQAMRALHRAKGFLQAEIGPVQVAGSTQLVVTVPVSEGPRARMAGVELVGTRREEAELLQALALQAGRPWDPVELEAAAQRLQSHYYRRGYPAARVGVDQRIEGADVVAVVTVEEGEPVVVAGLEIEGLTRTSERLVRRQAGLRPGAPLDPRRLATLEQRALDLGIFASAAASVSEQHPGHVRLQLQEGDRFVARYELRWDEGEQGSVMVDAELRNLLGLGVGLGARHRRGADVRETGVSLFAPSVLFGRDRLTLLGSDREEDLDAVDGATENVFRERTAALRHSFPLGRRWDLQYGYEFRHVTSSFLNVPIDLAGLDFSVLRDTRDDVLDTRRGQLWSASFEWATEALGSDFEFVKGYAQALAARRLSPTLTWAQGLRLGLSTGLDGQRVRSSERFRAGGSNSVRGFGTDELGPRDFLGGPAGGEAVFVLNEELRFHGPRGVGAVVFWDAGQVWPAVADIDLDLRHGLGAGLRYQSAVGVLRLDVAFPLARLAGEKAWRLYFSLGQAF